MSGSPEDDAGFLVTWWPEGQPAPPAGAATCPHVPPADSPTTPAITHVRHINRLHHAEAQRPPHRPHCTLIPPPPSPATPPAAARHSVASAPDRHGRR
jgi:hypothetical protein